MSQRKNQIQTYLSVESMARVEKFVATRGRSKIKTSISSAANELIERCIELEAEVKELKSELGFLQDNARQEAAENGS